MLEIAKLAENLKHKSSAVEVAKVAEKRQKRAAASAAVPVSKSADQPS